MKAILLFSEAELDFVWVNFGVMTIAEMGRHLNIKRTRMQKAYRLLGLPLPMEQQRMNLQRPLERPLVVQSETLCRYFALDSRIGISEADLNWHRYWKLPKAQRLRLSALEGCGV